MDLRRLRHAVFLADWGNFTAAAARLHLSQPALSRSIQSLEDELGLKLFERIATGVVTTAAGSAVVEEARTLLGQAEGLKAHAQRLSRGETGRVRIGLGPMFAGLLTDYLQAVWQPSQAVEVQVHILPVERLVSRLLSDDLDFFVADGRAARDHPSIAVEPIGTAPIGYHVRPGHELLDRKRLSVADIAAYPRASPNLPMVPLPKFDPTYVVLAMWASVEAIFLSTFVLISQNRMAEIADKRADLNLQISLLAEHEVTRLIDLVSAIAKHLELEEGHAPELDELKRDVQPEKVLDSLDAKKEEASGQSPTNF